jgi:hypothetical protein
VAAAPNSSKKAKIIKNLHHSSQALTKSVLNKSHHQAGQQSTGHKRRYQTTTNNSNSSFQVNVDSSSGCFGGDSAAKRTTSSTDILATTTATTLTHYELIGGAHLSHDEFMRQDELFAQKLNELRERHDLLKSLSRSPELASESKSLADKTNFMFVNEFLNELNEMELQASRSLSVIRYWLEKESNEIEDTFRAEYTRALQEYQEKRKDLKETLRNEHEEARKQIEIDRNTLDINTDVTEVKPPPTRNLRRRFNANLIANTTFGAEYASIDSANLIMDPITAVGVSASAASCSTVVGVSSSLNCSGSSLQYASTSGATSASVNCAYYLQQPYYSTLAGVNTTPGGSNNGLVAGVSASSTLNYINAMTNERKRKFGPVVFPTSEEEINEDHKLLIKNLNATTTSGGSGSNSKYNSSPKVHLTTTSAVAVGGAD